MSWTGSWKGTLNCSRAADVTLHRQRCRAEPARGGSGWLRPWRPHRRFRIPDFDDGDGRRSMFPPAGDDRYPFAMERERNTCRSYSVFYGSSFPGIRRIINQVEHVCSNFDNFYIHDVYRMLLSQNFSDPFQSSERGWLLKKILPLHKRSTVSYNNSSIS